MDTTGKKEVTEEVHNGKITEMIMMITKKIELAHQHKRAQYKILDRYDYENGRSRQTRK